MEDLTPRTSAVLDAIDEQIAVLEKKLEKAKPLFDELSRLRSARRALLSERGATANSGARARLDMESVVHYLRENQPSTSMAVGEALGFSDATVRSHFNRHKGTRYDQNGDGLWMLLEDSDEDEDE
jgi:hypothetical protein